MSSTTPSREEWIALRSKVWDAQKLARVILGHDATELTGTNLLQAMRKFASMKHQLTQLQRESQLTQKALLATQCSHTTIAKRLEKLNVEEEEDDEDIVFDVPNPEENLEEEIMKILPTKSKSIGVGLLGDMEQCIVEWQHTFTDLNDQHEFKVQACQADLERLHVRLDAMKALHPTGLEATQAAKKARDQLEKLVQIVEAFPSKARIEALQRELEASKRAEQQAYTKLALAVQELDAIRSREEELLHRLEEVSSPAVPVEKPKNRTIPTIRLLRYTKKKLQRLFRLDGNARTPSPSSLIEETNSSTMPSINEDTPLDLSDSGLNNELDLVPRMETNFIHLRKLTSAEEELHVFHHDVSDDEVDPEDWSVSDSLEIYNRQDVLLVHASPSKSNTSVDDLDLCKVKTDDTETMSFTTETDSSLGTPVKITRQGTHESRNFFTKAKNLLWVQ